MVCEHEYINIAPPPPPPNYRAGYATNSTRLIYLQLVLLFDERIIRLE